MYVGNSKIIILKLFHLKSTTLIKELIMLNLFKNNHLLKAD